MRRPEAVHGFQETHSLNSMVTDSAAAATAWGSGSRVDNRAINVLPDGTKLTTLAELARDKRRRIGLVTTTQMTHATPAGFATAQRIRSQQDHIAPQYLDRVDVLLGGGVEHFDPLRRSDGLDLIGRYTSKNYTYWNQRQQAHGPHAAKKVLGLFGTGHLPYTIDHLQSRELIDQVPTLSEMTRAAIGMLKDTPEGFVLQVEGGRIDHAAHNNDAAAILWDQLAFDDAVAEALKFADARDDTLVIVTTDHGNANPGLNGMGTGYADSNACFERLAECNASFDTLGDRIRQEEPSPQTVADVIKTHTGIKLTRYEAEILHSALGTPHKSELNAQHRPLVGVLGQILGNHTGIQFTGISHTADYSPLTAIGPGSHRFCGFQRNTDIFRQLTLLMDIDHQNPVAHANRPTTPHRQHSQTPLAATAHA